MTAEEAAMIMMGGGGTETIYDPIELFTKGTPEFIIGPFEMGKHTYNFRIFKMPTVSYDEYTFWNDANRKQWPALGKNVIATNRIYATYMGDTLLWGNPTMSIYYDMYQTSYRPTNYDVAFSSLYKESYSEREYTQISYDGTRELTGQGYGVSVPVKYYRKDILTYYSAETGEETSSSDNSAWGTGTIGLPRFGYTCVSPFSGKELTELQKIVIRDEWLLYNQLYPDTMLPFPE